jgi:hypothetical protein
MTMTEFTDGKPTLLVKKLGAMFFLLVGLLLTATGYAGGYSSLSVVGVILLAVGAVLLLLKIVRRNEAGT